MRQTIDCIKIVLTVEEVIGNEKVPFPEEMVSELKRFWNSVASFDVVNLALSIPSRLPTAVGRWKSN